MARRPIISEQTMGEANSQSSSELSKTLESQMDGEEFFNLSEEGEKEKGRAYSISLAKTGFGMAKQCLEEAYEGISDDVNAIEYLEDFAVPAFRYHHGFREEEPNIDLDYWKDRAINDIDQLPEITRFTPRFNPQFHVSTGRSRYPKMYEKIKEEFEKDQFDQIVGVFSSGIPPLYTASTYLEGDEIILRYSHRARDDDRVKITDTMEERKDFHGANVLIADDTKGTGETLQKVGDYILRHGAKEVKAIISIDLSIYDIESTFFGFGTPSLSKLQ